MIKRLRKRFIRIAMLATAIVMALLSLIVNVANLVSTDADLTELLDMICENQGTIPPYRDFSQREEGSAQRETVGGKKPGERKNFNQETPYSTRYFCLRFDGDGGLDSANLEHIAAITLEETGEYIALALAHGEGYGYASGYKYRVVRRDNDKYMAVFLDCYQEFHAVKVVAVCSLCAVAVCMTLVYMLVVFFSKKAIDPVVRSAERQKQFITDASHELKTPITVIATSLKVLEMEVGQQKWIDKSRAQTERLKKLVNSLVTLSRMDEEESPLQPAPFAISDSVGELAGSFQDLAQSRDHELQTSVESGLTYCGDEYAIGQLVSILLDNAVKYAAAGAPIQFSLKKAKKGVAIRTCNRCDAMDPADLDRLFDRFYRADRSRSAGGFGIGLSIARGIAEGHKGTIQARRPAEDQLEILVELK